MPLPGSEIIPRPGLPDELAENGGVVALLDAACLPGLPERIESRSLEARCLFRGELSETLRDVAPYLVRLDPGSPLLRDLINDGDLPWAMWHRRPGILIRTKLGLDALRRHFRRLLRVQTDEGTFFFRFWEPVTALPYFRQIDSSADRGRWFYPREGGEIDAFLIPDPAADGLHVLPAGAPRPDHRPWESRAFTLGPPELAALRATRARINIEQMVTLMAETFPDKTAALPPGRLEKGVRRSVSRCAEFGIRQRANAFRVAAWDLHSDGSFETVDPSGGLRQILITEMVEEDKMRLLLNRIAELGPANDQASAQRTES